MSKGKEQLAIDSTLFELSHGSQGLSDASYLALGAALERGPIRSKDGQVVVINPRVECAPKLTFRKTPLGILITDCP